MFVSYLQFKKKAIVFVEIEVGDLGRYIYVPPNKNKGRKSSLFLKSLKAVCSLENEVCLFPYETNTNLCKQIAHYMAQFRADDS